MNSDQNSYGGTRISAASSAVDPFVTRRVKHMRGVDKQNHVARHHRMNKALEKRLQETIVDRFVKCQVCGESAINEKGIPVKTITRRSVSAWRPLICEKHGTVTFEATLDGHIKFVEVGNGS